MFSSDPVVQVSHAFIKQGDQMVHHDVSFLVDKGEFVFLIGRTGSGKSSLLKALYADVSIHSGEIIVAGFLVHQLRPRKVPLLRRRVGIVFQDFQLFSDRTVSENLTFVMKATGWRNRIRMKTRLSEVLMQVGLVGTVEKKMPHQLSGGEQQRVAIARALINEPLILIADEPTGNLDPQVAYEVMHTFRQINKSGTAVLMATHSYGLIKKFPSRILKCSQGSLIDSENINLDMLDDEQEY